MLERQDILTAHAFFILLMVLNFFFFVLILFLNPFKVFEIAPPHGFGLNPLLQTHEMAFHPPTLFIGYAGSTIPFALALAGVYLSEDGWVFRARKWILFSWIWLTAGISIGAFWAYRVLGWGGFWGWDPVENASLLPWLTLTALMHSVMIQEARHCMKLWNILLAFATFEFVILGTYLTRSGVIGSVHAFGQSALSLPFTLFMLATLIATLAIINERREYIKSRDVIESIISKETTFLLNNLFFVAFALTVFWGTIFPILSEAVVGYQATIGPKYYNQVTSPLAFLLIALIGLCITIPWRRGSEKDIKRLLSIFSIAFLASLSVGWLMGVGIIGILAFTLFLLSIVIQISRYIRDTKAFKKEYGSMSYLKIILRKRRRYGGYTVHLGVILIFMGVVGTWVYAEEHNLTLETDKAYVLNDYTFLYRGYEIIGYPSKAVLETKIEVWKGDKLLRIVSPKIEKHYRGNQETRRVAIVYEPLQDIYLILNGVGEREAFLRVKFNPLVNLIWIGSLIMFLGGVLALLPKRFVLKLEGVKR
jgi:cytochrome c-type biogenesis protein CcmF